MAGQTINFTGSLLSNGGNVAYWGGAGGAGGSILVEGNNVTLSNASAVTGNGTAAGGVGRIAVYYEGNLTQGTINPAASTTVLGQAATATPTATPILNVTPTATDSNYYGSGVDGDLTVASGATYNINTNNNSPRSCADGIAYNVTGLTNSTAILSTTPANGCLAAGDEVLLINLQGTNTNYSNTGNYEFLHVGGTVGNAVYFTTPKIHFYGTNATDDSNIGTGAGQQVVMLMRVPNYHNVTINGTLTANAWNGNIYGVVAFRVSGTLTGGGIISATALGYPQSGGYVAGGQYQYGAGQNAPSSSGGNLLGGGGGYGSNGANGAVSGGLAYGDPNLNQIFLGGGGGKGGDCKNDCGDNYGGGPGDPGGGILFMAGQTINFTGSLLSNGGNVAYWGGAGGAGGSILVEGNNVTLSNASAVTGNGAAAGGVGRIAVYYQNSYSGNLNPAGYLQKGALPDSIFSDDFESGDLSKWSSSLTNSGNLSVSVASSYLGTYGLQAVIPAVTGTAMPNPEYIEDDLPIMPTIPPTSTPTGTPTITATSTPVPTSTPVGATQYNARFYVNPMGMTMGANDTLDLFDGYNSSTNVFKVQLQEPTSGAYNVRAGAMSNTSVWSYTSWVPVASNGWSAVEIDYQAGTSGSLTLYINGTSQPALTGIDNGAWTITSVRLGTQNMTSANTHGTLYFDSFELRRYSTIGLLLPPDLPTAQVASQAGWVGNDYAYDPNHPHAVAALTRDSDQSPLGSYTYDANGNMTCRMENGSWFIQAFNAENRLSVVQKLATGNCSAPGTFAAQWNFSYDGDGNRVAQAYVPYSSGNPGAPVITAYFMGGLYEMNGSQVKKYYSIAGMTIAMNDGSGANGLNTC